MTVSAISTAIPRGDKRRDYFFMLSVECAIYEEHGLGEPHHVLQQRWMGCKAPQDTRYVWPAEVGAKLRIEAFDLRCGVVIIHDRQVCRLGGR